MRHPQTNKRLADTLVLGVKFGLVGLVTVGVYFVFLALLQPFVPSVVILTGAAYVLSAVFNYIVQSRVTFRSKAFNGKAILRYLTMHGLCMALNSSLMHLLVDVWNRNLYLSQLAVTSVVAVTSFAVSYLWVYQDRQEPDFPS